MRWCSSRVRGPGELYLWRLTRDAFKMNGCFIQDWSQEFWLEWIVMPMLVVHMTWVFATSAAAVALKPTTSELWRRSWRKREENSQLVLKSMAYGDLSWLCTPSHGSEPGKQSLQIYSGQFHNCNGFLPSMVEIAIQNRKHKGCTCVHFLVSSALFNYSDPHSGHLKLISNHCNTIYLLFFRATREHWENLQPASGRPYCPAYSKPDCWGVTQVNNSSNFRVRFPRWRNCPFPCACIAIHTAWKLTY